MISIDEAPVKDVERFQKAMKAWLPAQMYVTKHGYIFDFPSDISWGVITCRECKRALNYGGPGVNQHRLEDWPEHTEWVEHTTDCRLMLAEKGLELLRKMATDTSPLSTKVAIIDGERRCMWISIEDVEKLPTLFETVWVLGHSQAIIGHRVEKPPTWRTDVGRWEIMDVTHWQPIVAPDPLGMRADALGI